MPGRNFTFASIGAIQAQNTRPDFTFVDWTNLIDEQLFHLSFFGGIPASAVEDSPGWTHFGIAIRTLPPIPGTRNDLIYFVIVFGKEV